MENNTAQRNEYNVIGLHEALTPQLLQFLYPEQRQTLHPLVRIFVFLKKRIKGL